MHQWQLQEAKAKLSELVKKAKQSGPQQITLHGRPCVVVIDQQEYQNLLKPKQNFVNFIRQSPLMGVELDLKRDKDATMRDIDL
jgi:antitoxin Phd